jgi:hypothetical protein
MCVITDVTSLLSPAPRSTTNVLYMMTQLSFSLMRGNSPAPSPPSRWTIVSVSTRPATFPLRRSAARVSPSAAACSYMVEALCFLFVFVSTHGAGRKHVVEDALVPIGRSSDRDLIEVADRIHGLGEPSICCALGPEERLGVRLWEYTGRADEVPRRERKARIAVVLLCCDVLQCRVPHGP